MGTLLRAGGAEGGRKGSRYVKGWKDTEQDTRPTARVARVTSQDYEVIKKECLAQKGVWEDPSFRATANSLFPSGKNQLSFEWKRPSDLCTDPQMFVDGFGRLDVDQGKLGNCWFIAATACLCCTKNQDLFHSVIPKDNVFANDYAGVFHFKFWQYGKWVDVVVDDRLPIVDGSLAFVHSPTNNEFWPSLLEKAYAKLNGCYEALDGGNTCVAMQDFTGGVTEVYDFRKDKPNDLFQIMKKAFERDSLMGCSVDASLTGGTREGALPSGLRTGHAYSITSVKQITVRGTQLNMVRVRNPWGNEAEWNGAWSDQSAEWTMLTAQDKESLGLNFEDDGEFWMSFDDFVNNFTELELCMTVPTYEILSEGTAGKKRRWELVTHEGSWKKNVNAGGCRNNIDTTFATNPQYRVDVVDPDEDDDDNTGTVIVALMQKDRRKKIAELGGKLLTIGYEIYELPPNLERTGPLDINFFKYNKCVAQSHTFLNSREMVGRHKLPPGEYLIVPSTFEPHQEGDFLLRIFSERKAPSSEMDEETRMAEDLPDVKVKRDVPILARTAKVDESGKKSRGALEVKGHMLSASEQKRKKSMAVTETDVAEEKAIRELFKKTAGVDMEIDANELRTILDLQFKEEFKFDAISLETARSMVAMLDMDHTGKLGFEEFKKLWIDLRRWKKIFLQYDDDKTLSLNAFEMRAVLNSAGYVVSNQTLKCIVMRYSDSKGCIQFDDFILCAVRLKTMFEIYKEMAQEATKQAQFNLDQFIQTTMYS